MSTYPAFWGSSDLIIVSAIVGTVEFGQMQRKREEGRNMDRREGLDGCVTGLEKNVEQEE